jgi:hypothetical protein
MTMKSTHESITGDDRGRSKVTRRLFMNSLVALPVTGALPIQSIAAADIDPIFAVIAAHQKAYVDLNAAESAHTAVEEELQAAGDLFPSIASRGNPSSGLPRPVSKTHADIDWHSPADLYPEDNKREHDELSAAIARRAAKYPPAQEAMDAAWAAERLALDRVIETVPTTMPGVMALLRVRRELWDAGGDDRIDAWTANTVCETVEKALLKLLAS